MGMAETDKRRAAAPNGVCEIVSMGPLGMEAGPPSRKGVVGLAILWG